MKRLVLVALVVLLALFVVPAPYQARASTSSPSLYVKSLYTLNRYGYAVVNETATFVNNSNSSNMVPSIQIGIGNLSTLAVSSVLVGSDYSMSSGSPGGPFNISAIQSIAPGSNSTFTISILLNGVTTFGANGIIQVLTLSTPSLSLPAAELLEEVALPGTSVFVAPPTGLSPITNEMYTTTLKNTPATSAVTSVDYMKAGTSTGFNPLEVLEAKRTITVSSSGVPEVTDYLSLENLGGTSLPTLYIAPLTSSGATVTVVPPGETKLINPVTVTLSGDGIDLASLSFGAPSASSSFTIAYQYPLAKSYYSIAGGQVTVKIPDIPPIAAFVSSYSILLSVPQGVTVVQGAPQPIIDATPRQQGTTTIAYSVTIGWAVDAGLPWALLVFGLMFAILFVSRGSMSAEEEEEEETSTEVASAMIKAFDEKTALINSLWSEISGMNPGGLSKAYFDEMRGKLDDFRGKALRRLNELKQKSTTQRFFELLTQIHETEREVDRASKDKLNLYEQYHTKRMRKEVFDRLLPQYTRRLERALNQLTDELHNIQKEAKLL